MCAEAELYGFRGRAEAHLILYCAVVYARHTLSLTHMPNMPTLRCLVSCYFTTTVKNTTAMRGYSALTHTRHCTRRILGVPGSAKRRVFNRGCEVFKKKKETQQRPRGSRRSVSEALTATRYLSPHEWSEERRASRLSLGLGATEQ